MNTCTCNSYGCVVCWGKCSCGCGYRVGFVRSMVDCINQDGKITVLKLLLYNPAIGILIENHHPEYKHLIDVVKLLK